MTLNEPTNADILLGRSTNCFNHPGNKAFRAFIHENLHEYLEAGIARKDRIRAIKSLIDRIRAQNCRFLLRDSTNQQWVDVSNEPIAHQKVSHALRDAAKNRSINTSLPRRDRNRSTAQSLLASHKTFGQVKNKSPEHLADHGSTPQHDRGRTPNSSHGKAFLARHFCFSKNGASDRDDVPNIDQSSPRGVASTDSQSSFYGYENHHTMEMLEEREYIHPCQQHDTTMEENDHRLEYTTFLQCALDILNDDDDDNHHHDHGRLPEDSLSPRMALRSGHLQLGAWLDDVHGDVTLSDNLPSTKMLVREGHLQLEDCSETPDEVETDLGILRYFGLL